MTLEISDQGDPFQYSIDLLESTIETQQKELESAVPTAKNIELQKEIAKVFSVYKQVLTKSIANIRQQQSIIKELSAIFLPHVSKQISLTEEVENKVTEIQLRHLFLCVEYTTYAQQIKTLGDRIIELKDLDAPSALPTGWWNQFGTSFGSSS